MEAKELLNAMSKEAGMAQKEFDGCLGTPTRTAGNLEIEVRNMPDRMRRFLFYKIRFNEKIKEQLGREIGFNSSKE